MSHAHARTTVQGRLLIVERHRAGWRQAGSREDEWSFVLEGEMGVEVGDQTLVAKPGDLVLKPRDVPHGFWNPGDVPARLLEVATPAEPDLAAVAAVATDFGLDIDTASIPRLVEAHGLRLS